MNNEITKEAVFEILNELRAMGIKPTVALLRERFHEASYSLISKYISEWSRGFHQSTSEKSPAATEHVTQGMARILAQARLLSDEEIEQERLDLGYQYQAIEKEKHDMLLEIQRLESEFRPQDMLQERFNAERAKLHAELDSLHCELKEIRLSQIDNRVNKQRLERTVIDTELEQGKLHTELKEKTATIDKLLAEKEMMQQEMMLAEKNRSDELSKAQHALLLAENKIESLGHQLEEQKKSEISPEEVKYLQSQIENLQTKLSHSELKLSVSTRSDSEQRAKQDALVRRLTVKKREYSELEKNLILEKQEYKTLEINYSRVKLELESLQNISSQEDGDKENSNKTEQSSDDILKIKSQYQKALKDKQYAYNKMLNNYERLKKENEALRAASKVQADITLTKNKADVHYIGDSELDNASENKMKEGEDIMALAREFVLEDEKRLHVIK